MRKKAVFLGLLLCSAMNPGELTAQSWEEARTRTFQTPVRPTGWVFPVDSASSPAPSWGARLVSGLSAAALGAGIGFFASRIGGDEGDGENGQNSSNHSTWAAVGGVGGFALGFSLPFWDPFRPGGDAPPARRVGEIITARDIQGSSVTNALEAVGLFHPEWLTPSSQGAFAYADADDIPVYLGGMGIGGIGALEGVPAEIIESIQLLRPQVATARLGPGHPYGAIQVVRRTEPRADAPRASGTAPSPSMTSPASPNPPPSHRQSWKGRLISGVAAAGLGAGVGFFASQVVLGDWDEESGDEEIHRSTWAVVGGASGFELGFSLPIWGRAPGRADPLPSYGNRFLITGDEIRQASLANAFEAVSFFHPEWLVQRGREAFEGNEPDTIRVYLDNAQLGGVNDLAGINTLVIESIRFHDAQSATTRFGSGHNHGAIQVITLG